MIIYDQYTDEATLLAQRAHPSRATTDGWATGSLSPFEPDHNPFTTEFEGADLLTDYDNVLLFRRRRDHERRVTRWIGRVAVVLAEALADNPDSFDF